MTKKSFLRRINIDERGCWIWQGAKQGRGYGHCRIRKKTIGAHRLAYILFKGQIPKGKQVCHVCDVRECVNPDHLWLGTNRENMFDALQKGRLGVKLSWKQVYTMRAFYDQGYSCSDIARRFSVSASVVRGIICRENWNDASKPAKRRIRRVYHKKKAVPLKVVRFVQEHFAPGYRYQRPPHKMGSTELSRLLGLPVEVITLIVRRYGFDDAK